MEQSPAKKYQHVAWTDVPTESPAAGIHRRMAVGQQLMVCRLRFDPFVVTPVHSHPHEQLTHVLSGEFEFTIGDETRVVRAGDTLYKRPGIVHGCTCRKAGVLLDTFTPQRDDFLAS